MLHDWSQAAVEHSRTRASHASLSLDDIDEENSEDETYEEAERISGCWRVGLCIGYIVPTWGHLTLANVGKSWAAGALALWHCYLFVASSMLIFVNCSTALLRFYTATWQAMKCNALHR